MSHASSPLCPVCTSSDAKRRYRLSEFDVLRCVACGLVYIWPQMTDEEVREMFTRLYTEGEGSVPELKSYYDYCYEDAPDNPLVRQYEHWLDRVEKHRAPGRILDVGCGTGLFLSVARRRGREPFGIDDSDEATRHAREHFGLDVWVGDFADFHAEGRRFDAITGWDIIEHARKPLELLEAMHACLAPKGVVALSTPNQRSVLDVVAGALYRLSGGRATAALEKFYIEQHFLYFTPDTLAQALGMAGFEVADLQLESTNLDRLTLSPAMRLVLQSMFVAARWTGLQNRLFAVARAR